MSGNDDEGEDEDEDYTQISNGSSDKTKASKLEDQTELLMNNTKITINILDDNDGASSESSEHSEYEEINPHINFKGEELPEEDYSEIIDVDLSEERINGVPLPLFGGNVYKIGVIYVTVGLKWIYGAENVEGNILGMYAVLNKAEVEWRQQKKGDLIKLSRSIPTMIETYFNNLEFQDRHLRQELGKVSRTIQRLESVQSNISAGDQQIDAQRYLNQAEELYEKSQILAEELNQKLIRLRDEYVVMIDIIEEYFSEMREL